MSIVRRAYEFFSQVADAATLPTDSPEEKTKKGVLTMIASIIAFLAIFWGSTYVWLGYPWSGVIPLSYAVISLLSIAYFFISKHFEFFRFSQLLLIFLLPFLLMWSLGGFANGSVVMVWAFFTPLAAMLFADVRHATRWIVAFLVFTVLSAAIDSTIMAYAKPMEQIPNVVFFLLNMGFGFASIFLVLSYFVKEREKAHQVALHAKLELEHSNKQLLENEAKIREMMLTDWLTGAANRRYLDEQLKTEINRKRRYGGYLSIIMTDLDHFKRINDNYGHDKGDAVISLFTSVIDSVARESDFVARYGGEEFLVIVPGTDLQGAKCFADRIRIAMAETDLPGISTRVTASFGVTAVTDKDTVDSVMKRVDNALYKAKDAGRNCVVTLEG